MARNRSTKTTSSRIVSSASRVLKDSKCSSTTKSLAGSVLSQSARKASHSTRSIAERILTRHDKAFSELSKK